MLKKILPLLFIFTFFLIQLLFSLKALLPLAIDEAQKTYVAKSLISNAASYPSFIDFTKSQGHSLFSIPIVFLIPFTFLPHSFVLNRIPQLTAGFFLYFILFALMMRLAGEENKFKKGIVISLLIILSPWLQALVLFHLPETLSLVFILSALVLLVKPPQARRPGASFLKILLRRRLLANVHSSPSSETRGILNLVLKLKEDPTKVKLLIFISILLLLASLSSWSGLMAAFFLPLIIFAAKLKITRQKVFVFLFLFYLPLGMIIYKNKDYVRFFIKERSFLTHLAPKRLADEINERQKVDFLSANRNFILPSPVRKFIYNKPTQAFEKILQQGVSFFDYEQYAFPLISYDEVRLSEIPPKGNLPLGYFWDLPLIAIGIYYLFERKLKTGLSSLLLIPLFLPYFFFEKRHILISASLLLPFIIFLEVYGSLTILKRVDQFRKIPRIISKIFLTILLITLITSVYEQYKLIYFEKHAYQTSDLYFFQQISDKLSSHKKEFQKIVVTDRFGATALMTSFYLNISPKVYWESVAKNERIVNIENVEFRNIDSSKETFAKENLYIGFPGEFTKPGENPNDLALPHNFSLIDEIVAPDEIVYHYGKNIWIVKINQ